MPKKEEKILPQSLPTALYRFRVSVFSSMSSQPLRMGRSLWRKRPLEWDPLYIRNQGQGLNSKQAFLSVQSLKSKGFTLGVKAKIENI